MDFRSLEYIQAQMPPEELLAQLAEEATELARAALKLRRVLGCSNPTPVTREEALGHLAEEVADVDLLLVALWPEVSGALSKCQKIMDAKLQRWVDRLKAAELKKEGEAECTP